MAPDSKSRPVWAHVALLVVLCAALYFPYLGSTPFFDKGEPREAMAVQDIMTRGEWLVPLKRATDIPSKPPLFHWSAALTSSLSGKLNEATIRFPSALYATLTVLMLYLLARRLFDPDAALLGGAILATTLVYANQALSARVDMTLCFVVTLSLTIFYRIYKGFLTSPLWYYVFYATIGIGTLAKGPLSIVLSALVCAAFVLSRRRWDLVRKFCFHPGVILMIVLGAGWYVVAVTRGGEGFFSRQIIEENLARFAGGSGHSHPVHYYVPYLFSQGLPWSIFLPFLLWDYFKRKSHANEDKLFFGVWFAVMFGLFSLSVGKRPVYLLPLYPALSILLGLWFRETVAGRIRLWLMRCVSINAVVVGVLLLVITLGALWNHDPGWFFEPIGKLLRAKDRANLMTIRHGLDDFSAAFTVVAVLSAVLWLALAGYLWQARLKAAARSLVVISILLAFVSRAIVLPAIAEGKSYKPFVAEVNRAVNEHKLYLYGDFNSDAVVFYRGEPIEILRELSQANAAEQSYVIMPTQKYDEVRAAGAQLPAPLIRSAGTGPEGDAPLVLIGLGSINRPRQSGSGRTAQP